MATTIDGIKIAGSWVADAKFENRVEEGDVSPEEDMGLVDQLSHRVTLRMKSDITNGYLRIAEDGVLDIRGTSSDMESVFEVESTDTEGVIYLRSWGNDLYLSLSAMGIPCSDKEKSVGARWQVIEHNSGRLILQSVGDRLRHLGFLTNGEAKDSVSCAGGPECQLRTDNIGIDFKADEHGNMNPHHHNYEVRDQIEDEMHEFIQQVREEGEQEILREMVDEADEEDWDSDEDARAEFRLKKSHYSYSLELHDRSRHDVDFRRLLHDDSSSGYAVRQKLSDNFAKPMEHKLFSREQYLSMNACGQIPYTKKCSELHIVPSSKILKSLAGQGTLACVCASSNCVCVLLCDHYFYLPFSPQPRALRHRRKRGSGFICRNHREQDRPRAQPRRQLDRGEGRYCPRLRAHRAQQHH
jgi:hypothetical protein